MSRHLQSVDPGDRPGKRWLGLMLDSFQLSTPSGSHRCLIFPPLGLTLTDFRNLLPGRAVEQDFLQYTVYFLLQAIEFLHRADVVHTGLNYHDSPPSIVRADGVADISPNNILMGVQDHTLFETIEHAELAHPSPRKVLPDRTIYLSSKLDPTAGPLTLCDFGAARIGQKHIGDVMPDFYRAPEVILGSKWDHKIDIWSVGVMVSACDTS